MNPYLGVHNNPVSLWDRLGLLTNGRYIKESWSISPPPDFAYDYDFNGRTGEEVIQVVTVNATYSCEGRQCGFYARFPERFQMDDEGRFAFDQHYFYAQAKLDKYCGCICTPCCKEGSFRVTLDFRLFYGGTLSAPGSGDFSVLDSVTLGNGSSVVREQSVTDCDGMTWDASAEFDDDWDMRPIGGTGTIGLAGRGSGVFKLTHTYDGAVRNCRVTGCTKPVKEDYQ